MSFGIINRHLTRACKHFTLLRLPPAFKPSKQLFEILQKLPCTNHQNSISQKTFTWDSYKNFSSQCSKETLNVDYKELQKAQKDDKVLIIDVREQDEINETGKLPGSIHIPMGNVAKNLTCMSDDEFKKAYGRDKPTKETQIILSCKMGKRSGMVQEELQKLGYKNALNFTGGWLEWEKNQKSNCT